MAEEKKTGLSADGWLGIWALTVSIVIAATCGFAPNCANEPSCDCICEGDWKTMKDCKCECSDLSPGFVVGETE